MSKAVLLSLLVLAIVFAAEGKHFFGQTTPGKGWQRYSDKYAFIDIDTSAAGFTTTPVYITSIGGNGWQWTLQGVTSLYNPSPNTFRIYVMFGGHDGDTLQKAQEMGWHVNWFGIDAGDDSIQIGKNTNWVTYSADGIYIDVTTPKAFTEEPSYFSTVTGTSSHWSTTGASSIYQATKNAFRVYIWNTNVKAARDYQYTLTWIGIAGSHQTIAHGNSGSNSFQKYGDSGIYVDIDTSVAGAAHTPIYITSLFGNSGNWYCTGGSTIYEANPTHFRSYLRYRTGSLTVDIAAANKYNIHWFAPTSRKQCTSFSSPRYERITADILGQYKKFAAVKDDVVDAFMVQLKPVDTKFGTLSTSIQEDKKRNELQLQLIAFLRAQSNKLTDDGSRTRIIAVLDALEAKLKQNSDAIAASEKELATISAQRDELLTKVNAAQVDAKGSDEDLELLENVFGTFRTVKCLREELDTAREAAKRCTTGARVLDAPDTVIMSNADDNGYAATVSAFIDTSSSAVVQQSEVQQAEIQEVPVDLSSLLNQDY